VPELKAGIINHPSVEAVFNASAGDRSNGFELL
jgi:hypothetical protein